MTHATTTKRLSSIGLGFDEAVVSGSYLYTIDTTNNLVIYDISIATEPMKVGETGAPPAVYDLEVDSGYLYMAAAAQGVKVYDVSTPSAPDYLDSLNTAGSAMDLAVHSTGYVYVADSSNGLVVVDATTPSALSTAMTLSTDIDTTKAVALDESTSLLHVVDTDGAGYAINAYNISAPESPSYQSAYAPGHDVVDLAVASSNVVYSAGDSGLQIVDPTASWSLTGSLSGTDQIYRDFVISSSVAYLSNPNSGAVAAVDLSTLSSPSFLGSYSPVTGYPGLAASGTTVYVASRARGLVVVDMASPSTPSASTPFGGAPGDPRAIAVDGSYAFIANSFGGLVVVDISSPASPTYVDTVALGGRIKGLDLVGSTLYAAGSDGLFVLDVSTPTSPTVLGTYAGYNYADVAVEGSYAFLAAYWGGLQVLNVSDPTNITLANAFDPWSSSSTKAYAVDVAAGTAYVANYAGGMHVVDVSDPANPAVWGSYTGIKAVDVAFDSASNTALVTNYTAETNDGGLLFLDVSTPATPELSSLVSLGYPKAIQFSGSTALAASSTLSAVDFTDPTSPRMLGQYYMGNIIPEGIALGSNAGQVFIPGNGAGILAFDHVPGL